MPFSEFVALPTRGDAVAIDRVFKDIEATLRERGETQVRASGTASDTGNGALTAFSFAHEMGEAPSSAVVTAKSSAAAGDFYVTVDATNITVNYVVAPSGSLSWYWMAT